MNKKMTFALAFCSFLSGRGDRVDIVSDMFFQFIRNMRLCQSVIKCYGKKLFGRRDTRDALGL